MIKLDIKSELPQAAKWTNEHTKQLPFSIAQAITATSNAVAVAEHVIYMMLSISKSENKYDEEVRVGKFKKNVVIANLGDP